MRRLLSLRWAGFVLVCALAAVLCVLAARWQWARYEESAARNALVESSRSGPGQPIADVLPAAAPTAPLPDADEFRLVRVVGTYDAARALTVRSRSRDGQQGAEALVPLRTRDGAALLVDRGWFPVTGGPAAGVAAAPAPPSGPVVVDARLRRPASGASFDEGTRSVREVDVDELRGVFPYPLYGAWAELVREDPRPAVAPALPEEPSWATALHVAYTVQWYAFSVVAVVGPVLLMRAEVRGTRHRGPAPAATGRAGPGAPPRRRRRTESARR